MKKIIIFYLIFVYLVIIQTTTLNDIITIEEQVPKAILFDMFEYSPYQILHYNPYCNENSNSDRINITFQIYSDSFYGIHLYLYNDFSSIQRSEKGEFIDYIYSDIIIKNSIIPFNDLICGKDYYFLLSGFHNDDIYLSLFFKFYNILILNEARNIINLSPLLSDYYSIIPREKDNIENLFYSFNEDKYVFIIFNEGVITLKEDNITIYENKENMERYLKKGFEFQKDKEYNIFFNSSSPIKIYFGNGNESDFFKHDFNNGPIIISSLLPKYIYEINISNYEIGDYIIFQKDDNNVEFELKYQYKNDFKQNNFIDLGVYNSFNYIPIKKTKNDSLLLYIKSYHDEISLLSLYKHTITEITDNYNEILTGPKLFYIDYYTLNNLKSFGIEANQSYYFFEQNLDNIVVISREEYNNITIITQNNAKPYIFKRAFVVFNKTGYVNFNVQKFNYSIFKQSHDNSNPYSYEYFQICQGESTLKELYFYINKPNNEIFTAVFGKYDAYFIQESEIKSLSDFDFNKIAETNFFQKSKDNGFLKISCNRPAMVKFFYIGISLLYEDLKIFSSGRKYTLIKKIAKNKFNLDHNLINKTIPLKFSLLGLKEDISIELFIDDYNYTLNNSESLEVEYFYEQNNKGLIFFNFDENIEKTMVIEIIVGFIKENFDNIRQVNFNDSIGNIELEEQKGVIIKIPQELNEDLYNFSIIIPKEEKLKYNDNYYDIQIQFDKKEFIVPKYELFINNYISRNQNYFL